MLDIKLFRDNPDLVRQSLIKRHEDPMAVDMVIEIDEKRRDLIQQVENLSQRRMLPLKRSARSRTKMTVNPRLLL